ncbi:sugar ABC transporter permease [Lachnospiraceae bacterium ASD3451]|uniref:carbohydrate ABC transporter permease n=1 Tax=Diplocloster agilis TaxID=2850323 RepID=UPI001DB3EDA6|nr:sugar ABC transporter permease [Diplocloster agilis]MBU9742623.1 sugar ABC transporter permease [Diplocloster agilis]
MKYIKWKNSILYFLFILPALFFFFLFFLYPFFRSLWISLTDAYGFNPEIHFIGLANYWEALSNKGFLNSIWVTVKYTAFVTIFANVCALFFALLLDGRCAFKKFFRAVFFLPNLMSLIIISFVWVFIYGSVYRSFVSAFSIPEAWQISWLGNEKMALISMGITAIWQCAGYYMLIYIASLQNISPELIEAAAIDGASKFQIIRKIKLPLLVPTIVINTILLITAGFKTFDIPLAMTSGGPAGATTTIALQIYNTGFRSNRTGYAAAQSVVLFLIISVITAVLYLFQNRKGGSDS